MVDPTVDEWIVLREAQEDEVVDGDHAFDALRAQSPRQLTREAVEELHLLIHGITDDAPLAPQRTTMTPEEAFGKAQCHSRQFIGTVHGLGLLRIGDKEVQAQVGGPFCKAADDKATIVAQSRLVLRSALGVEAYMNMFMWHAGEGCEVVWL